MAIHIGVDLGAISVKAALYSDDPGDTAFFEKVQGDPLLPVVRLLRHPGDGREVRVAVSAYQRIAGNPLRQTRGLLEQLIGLMEGWQVGRLAVTGSGGALLKNNLGLNTQNEFRALAKAVELLHPEVRTLFEMGGESSKFLLLERDEVSGKVGIVDYSTNGDCAAGTGGFLDQQAGRLRLRVEEIGAIVAGHLPRCPGSPAAAGCSPRAT